MNYEKAENDQENNPYLPECFSKCDGNYFLRIGTMEEHSQEGR